MDWPEYFMSLVYLTAMKSRDPTTHLGAVIVTRDNTIISVGYNGLPRNVEYQDQRLERPEKYFWFEHAERNAIYNAIRIGARIEGAMMYTNGVPRCDCARAVIQAGLKKIVVDKEWDAENKDRWLEEANKSKQMFLEAGVTIELYNGPIIKTIEKFRRGKIIANE